MFSAPPIPRPTHTIRSAVVRSTPSSGGTTEFDERRPQAVQLGRRRELDALAPAGAVRLVVQGRRVDREHRRQRRARRGLQLPAVDPADRLRLATLERQADAVADEGKACRCRCRGGEVVAGRGVLEQDEVRRARLDRRREHRLVRFREVGGERGVRHLEHHVRRRERIGIDRLAARHQRHQRPAGSVCQRAREREQPVVDRRVHVDQDVAHQLTRAPRSRSTATICAATCFRITLEHRRTALRLRPRERDELRRPRPAPRR